MNIHNDKKEKLVIVGLSGGVDSSVSAALLLEQGYRVIGVFMKNWSDNTQGCCSTDQDLADARRVAQVLGIPFYVWNFERQYQERVMEYFFAEYKAGRTPNPDVMCNKEIKFKLFLDRALQMGADYIATGHYARNLVGDQGYELHRGLDPSKDQSYFLCQLTQTQLAHSLFPIGELLKTDVRKLAAKFKLSTAQKKDSQGICFIGNINVKKFLQANIPSQPGKIIDTKGEIIGKHDGTVYYTLGQREGLDIGNGQGPYYVVAKNMATNQIIVSADQNDKLLWRQTFTITALNLVNNQTPWPTQADVQICYGHPAHKAKLEKTSQDQITITFDQPQRAITPGQLAAIYLTDKLIGCGVITKVL
jgi:tRNA-specific 2-thiouridylase